MKPVITYAGPGSAPSTIEVDGYVPDIVETTGTCRAVLSAAGQTREATGPALADASTTICEPLTLPTDGLRPGQATVVLHYTSSRAAGSSTAFQIEIG